MRLSNLLWSALVVVFIRSLAAATLLLSAPVFSQSVPTAANPPAAAVEKKVCRRGETPTGSMMPPKRTCHTAAEWKAIDGQAAAARAADPNAGQNPAATFTPSALQ